jgi:HJR/Mrr/RecB family endonuclease
MTISSLRTKGKKKGVDLMFQKLARLPVTVHLTIAGLLAAIGAWGFAFKDDLLVASLSIAFALLFVFLGGIVLRKEMHWYKFLEKHASEEQIRNLTQHGFEEYLMALYSLSGYRLRSAVDEVHRQDDADIILEKRKEVVLLQTNHWNEPITNISSIRSLQKAAYILNANSCSAITLGSFTQEAIDWAKIKGVRLITARELIDDGRRALGFPVIEATDSMPAAADVEDHKQSSARAVIPPTVSWDGPKPIIPKSAIASLPDDYYQTAPNANSLSLEAAKSVGSRGESALLKDGP